jgi:membrane protease YdiL (CAAX protease family)
MVPMLPGLMMPAIIAALLIWRQRDPAMAKDFVRRCFSLRLINPGVLFGTLLLMPLSVLIAITLSVLAGGSPDQFQFSGAFSFSTGFIPVLALLWLAAIFEEVGWRGYGFESLEKGRTFLAASIMFGVFWSLWHLPLLWVNDSYQYEIFQKNPWFAVNFFVGTVILGVIISWVCHINRRSILAAVIFHFVINISQEMLSMTQATKSIQTLVLLVFVVIIVLLQRPLFLRRKE